MLGALMERGGKEGAGGRAQKQTTNSSFCLTRIRHILFLLGAEKVTLARFTLKGGHAPWKKPDSLREDVHCSMSIPHGITSDKALGNITRQCLLWGYEKRGSGRPGRSFHHEELISAGTQWKTTPEHYVTQANLSSQQREEAIQVKDKAFFAMHRPPLSSLVSDFELCLLPISTFASPLGHRFKF